MLYPYQKTGIEWLVAHKHAILADEMGLGKTIQAIKAADAIGAQNILVICPAIARVNWAREFDKFSTVSRITYVFTRRTETPIIRGVQICSYELIKHIPFESQAFDLVILDEAHFLKSVYASRTQSVLGKGKVVHNAMRVWALTGTPMPNHPGELWPMLTTFGKIDSTYEVFCRQFCSFAIGATYRPQPRIVGAKKSAIPTLRNILSTTMLRRMKKDVLPDLPSIIRQEIFVERGSVSFSAEMLEKVKEELARLEIALDEVRDDGKLKILEALAGSVSTLRLYLGLQKVAATIELIRQDFKDKAYDKVVIFCHHVDVWKELFAGLYAFNVRGILGSTSLVGRQTAVDQFQNQPQCKVFLASLYAAGTAITLTAAHNVVIVEQDWVPATNEQAIARCHRIGSKYPVHVRTLTIADSIDDKIAKILFRKEKDIQEIIGS